jgi:hypothetical protein
MKKKGYRVVRIPNFCTICPNDYWHQVQDCCEYRFNSESDHRR